MLVRIESPTSESSNVSPIPGTIGILALKILSFLCLVQELPELWTGCERLWFWLAPRTIRQWKERWMFVEVVDAAQDNSWIIAYETERGGHFGFDVAYGKEYIGRIIRLMLDPAILDNWNGPIEP